MKQCLTLISNKQWLERETGWPSVLGRWISMRWPGFKSRSVLFWVSAWFNSLVILVNSQLVCLPPVGILNSVVFICIICFIGPEKPLQRSGQLRIYLFMWCAWGVRGGCGGWDLMLTNKIRHDKEKKEPVRSLLRELSTGNLLDSQLTLISLQKVNSACISEMAWKGIKSWQHQCHCSTLWWSNTRRTTQENSSPRYSWKWRRHGDKRIYGLISRKR